MIRRVEDVVRRVEALPGVASAMASGMVPLGGGGSGAGVVAEGVAVTPGEEPDVSYYGVTPHALRTLNAAAGCRVAISPTPRAPAAPASRSSTGHLARRLWPDAPTSIGQRFRLTDDKTNQWITVIGLVADFRLFAERGSAPPPLRVPVLRLRAVAEHGAHDSGRRRGAGRRSPARCESRNPDVGSDDADHAGADG